MQSNSCLYSNLRSDSSMWVCLTNQQQKFQVSKYSGEENVKRKCIWNSVVCLEQDNSVASSGGQNYNLNIQKVEEGRFQIPGQPRIHREHCFWKQAGEIAQCLRVHTAIARTWVQFPAPMAGNLPLPLTSVPRESEDFFSSVSIYIQMHECICTCTNTYN